MTNSSPARLRVAFMGTPDFSVPSLKALIEAGHDVVAVYTQPPRPAGRGKTLRKSPVHLVAEEAGLEVRTPRSLKKPEVQEEFAALNLDVCVVAAYGLILPKEVLDAPRMGCLNVHASLLPRWRGAAPINRAIMAGDAETGITIMQMDEGLDTGDMLRKLSLPLAEDITAGQLHDQLAALGGPMMVEVLDALAKGELTPQTQSEVSITYADKISKSEARIDWTKPASDVDCQIRGLSPFPGAWFEVELNGKTARVKVLRSRRVYERCAAEPGTVLTDDLVIACGAGAVQLLELQREGKKAQKAGVFLRGFTIAESTKLN